VGFFGLLLHHWARRELRKGGKPPRLREYLRVAKAWEIGLEAALIVAHKSPVASGPEAVP
jgi:hypothetical protein